MNPNKELLQAIIDGKTVQYQYVSPSEENAILLGQWYDFKPDLLGSINHSATVQIFGLSVEDEFKMIFRVME